MKRNSFMGWRMCEFHLAHLFRTNTSAYQNSMKLIALEKHSYKLCFAFASGYFILPTSPACFHCSSHYLIPLFLIYIPLALKAFLFILLWTKQKCFWGSEKKRVREKKKHATLFVPHHFSSRIKVICGIYCTGDYHARFAFRFALLALSLNWMNN